MNIAFCDDDKQCLKRLTRLAKDIIDKNNVYDFSFNYFEYDNPVEFLKEHEEKKFDAVFLDIEMPLNGLIVGDEAFKINHVNKCLMILLFLNQIIFFHTTKKNL